MLLHSGYITGSYSGLDTDMLLIHRRLGPKSDSEKTTRIIHSAQRTCTRFAWFPHSYMVAEQVILELWYWDIEWRWHLLKKLRC